MFRRASVVAIAGVAAVFMCTPAWAVVAKSGNKSCSTYGITRSYSSGFTQVAPPGSGYREYQNGASLVVRTSQAPYAGGGNWTVNTNGSLNDPGTYSYCSSGS